jgi:diguanylate cyclase (GGDEF)-like protein/putative nucleotidyltransferase with HDIG domain
MSVMGRYTLGAKIWIGAVTGLAVLATAARLDAAAPTPIQWLALALLALAAAAAHVFPIRSAVNGATYRMTNVFVIAGAVVLPAALVALVPALAMTPDSWRGRRRPGVVKRWLFNVSQAVLTAQIAGALVTWTGAARLSTPVDLVGLIGAAAAFTLTQATMVGVIIALNSNIPLARAGTFAPPALLGESLIDVLALLVAGLWLTQPLLLTLVAPVLFIAYRMTRTAHMAHLAEVDSKTGLHNLRHLERVLEEEVGRSARLKRPLAVLLADLDHFKQVNDEYGHAAGDRVLREVAGILTDVFRKGDVIARWGGDEFVVLLPDTEADEAAHLAERARAAVAGHGFEPVDGALVRCTMSIGVALCPQDACDMEGLLGTADAAMYRAKQRRDAVACVPALSSVPRLPSPEAPSTAPPAVPPAPPRLALLALWLTVAGGVLVGGASLVLVVREAAWLTLAPFLGLAIVAEFLEVRIYESNRERMSFSFTIAVTMAAVTANPACAPLVSLAAAVAHVLVARQRQIDKVLFNLSNTTLSAAAAASAYALLQPAAETLTVWHLGAALVAVAVFHVVNFGIVSVMIGLHSRRSIVEVFARSVWSAPIEIFVGLTGAFLGSAHGRLDTMGTLMFAVPILLLRYSLAFYARRSAKTIETLQAAKAEVERAHQDKEETLRGLIDTVASIIDAREPWVLGHSRRVAKYAVAIGRELGLSTTELAFVHTGGLLHDLGKVGIPEAILNKPDRLTDAEFDVMRGHAALGERILSDVKPLAIVTRIVGEHHERYDGSGYPRGIGGNEISVGGRIVALADALDAILSDRPYSRARSLEWALAEADRCAGTHFDPAVVAALHRAVATLGDDFFESPAGFVEPEPVGDCCRWRGSGNGPDEQRGSRAPSPDGGAPTPTTRPLPRNGAVPERVPVA